MLGKHLSFKGLRVEWLWLTTFFAFDQRCSDGFMSGMTLLLTAD
jgi:hypothetical protein